MTIHYLTGDATEPVKKPALIMHVCNDVGGWGRGFVLALSKKWKDPEAAYRRRTLWPLGDVDFVWVADGVAVANMIAQRDVRPDSGVPPIRYQALAVCLGRVHEWTAPLGDRPDFSIHAPRIGCGLAGGSWSRVEPLIKRHLKDREVYIYDLPQKE
jgi:O-acetyl-ADP-ribose deacetylase (regulator of RNase III)